MTEALQRLRDVAGQFDAIVLDQWGVLHNGSTPYPTAIDTLRDLRRDGVRMAVLSNSGKRAAPNAERIEAMGFDADLFDTVMTSGEALWRDIDAGRVDHRTFFAITRAEGDAATWAAGLDIALTDDIAAADAVLLMGIPDNAGSDEFADILSEARNRKLPLLCTNPDRASPRADGELVLSPGTLAHAYADNGGDVRFYGKPHRPVFDAIARTLETSLLLMVGDSLEHDIAGGHGAGWSTLFVQGGLHDRDFDDQDPLQVISRLAAAHAAPMPTFTLRTLR